ncbi:TetR/AcrR family transcriptional regulator [Okibacterium endophyticum]
MIANTAIEIIDSQGVRALTHRRVDAAAGLPPGTTSYYAPTRKDLLALAVERISKEPAFEPLVEDEYPRPSTVAEAVPYITSEIERTAEAAPVLRARASILPELREWPELQEPLFDTAPIALATRPRAIAILGSIGVSHPDEHAEELLALCEALVMLCVTRPGALDPGNVLTHYLTGLGGRVEK